MNRAEYDQWCSDQRAEREARQQAERRAERERERFAEQAASDDDRFVFATLPKCPSCGGVRHKSYRSIDQGDGSRMKWTTCQTCGEKFILILE